jgi:hypothetical protein
MNAANDFDPEVDRDGRSGVNHDTMQQIHIKDERFRRKWNLPRPGAHSLADHSPALNSGGDA